MYEEACLFRFCSFSALLYLMFNVPSRRNNGNFRSQFFIRIRKASLGVQREASSTPFSLLIESKYRKLCKNIWFWHYSALYQLHLVKSETARAFIPKEFRLVEAFGYESLGCYSLYLRSVYLIRVGTIYCTAILWEDSFLLIMRTVLLGYLMRLSLFIPFLLVFYLW